MIVKKEDVTPGQDIGAPGKRLKVPGGPRFVYWIRRRFRGFTHRALESLESQSQPTTTRAHPPGYPTRVPHSQAIAPPAPGLLVSVRDAPEGAVALAAGADVIDVKRPDRGPLGRADSAGVAQIASVVAGRRPVTAAAGDWGELSPGTLADWAQESGAAVVKFGLPDGFDLESCQDALRQTRRLLTGSIQLAPALYADLLPEGPPDPPWLSRLAGAVAAQWLVVDTHDKSRGNLLDAWTPEQLRQLLQDARGCGLRVVLAGSLSGDAFAAACRLGPTLVGVRGAACEEGRSSLLCGTKIAQLAAVMRKAAGQPCEIRD